MLCSRVACARTSRTAQLYTKLVKLAGFTVSGREWIANGFVSAFISVLTFVVYANMTRTEWAYPSGEESDLLNQWISGHAMTLATVIMNMVYLTSETRSRIGEPGINDPTVKIGVTAVTFYVLYVLNDSGNLDPSLTEVQRAARNSTSAMAATTNVHLPLPSVCDIRRNGPVGLAVFAGMSIGCLGFVIFGTSAQSMSGLQSLCGCGKRKPPQDDFNLTSMTVTNDNQSGVAAWVSTASISTATPSFPRDGEASSQRYSSGPKRKHVRNAAPVDKKGRAVPMGPDVSTGDRIRGKCCLFFIFLTLVWLNVCFFTFVALPIGDYSTVRTRDLEQVREMCSSY